MRPKSSRPGTLRIFAAGIVSLVCAAEGAMSQLPVQSKPYPLSDIPVTLSSGTVIRIRNIVFFRGQNGSGLTLYIETPTPPTDPERVGVEAREVLKFQFKSVRTENPTAVSVGICRTQGCLEMREIPQEMFLFVRQSDGSWQAVKWPDAR
jgi:hypothetical protein